MSQFSNQRSAIKALQNPNRIRISSQSNRKQAQKQVKEQIEREFQTYKQNLQAQSDTIRSEDKEKIFSCKDFVKTLHKKDCLDYNHILLYKSIQPFPLRESVEKLKIRDASKIADPPKANQVEIMKLNNIREYLSKHQEQTFQQQLKEINSQKGYSTKNYGNTGGTDLETLVKTDYLNNLKERMKTGSVQGVRSSAKTTDRQLMRQSTQAQFMSERVGDYDEIIYDSVDFQKQNTFDSYGIGGAAKTNYSQFQEHQARQNAKEVALDELRRKLASQKYNPKKLSDIEEKAQQQPIYFNRYKKPQNAFQSKSRISFSNQPYTQNHSRSNSRSSSRLQQQVSIPKLNKHYQSQSQLSNTPQTAAPFLRNIKSIEPIANRTASQAVFRIETNRINLFSSPNEYQNQYKSNRGNVLVGNQGMLFRDEGDFINNNISSMPQSPVMSPLRQQMHSVNTALSLNDNNKVKHRKYNQQVVLKPNSIPMFSLTGGDIKSQQSTNNNNHMNSHRTLRPLASVTDFQEQDYASPDNFAIKNQKARNQVKQSTSSHSKQKNSSFNRKTNNNSINSSFSKYSHHDNQLLQELIENCDNTTKKLKYERTKISKNKKQIKQIFNQFKNRVRFNLQVNKQESLPEDMLEIKHFRHEVQKMESNSKELQELHHLEEMASKYQNWKQKLEMKLKEKEEITIKEAKQFYDNYKSQKGVEKAEKIPARLKQKKLNAILEDKSLIEIYNNFELQYLNHTKRVREENSNRKREANIYAKLGSGQLSPR